MVEDEPIVVLNDKVEHTCVPVHYVHHCDVAAEELGCHRRQSSAVYHKLTRVRNNSICHPHIVIRTIT